MKRTYRAVGFGRKRGAIGLGESARIVDIETDCEESALDAWRDKYESLQSPPVAFDLEARRCELSGGHEPDNQGLCHRCGLELL